MQIRCVRYQGLEGPVCDWPNNVYEHCQFSTPRPDDTTTTPTPTQPPTEPTTPTTTPATTPTTTTTTTTPDPGCQKDEDCLDNEWCDVSGAVTLCVT